MGNADAPIAGFLKASSRMALVVPGLLNDISIYIYVDIHTHTHGLGFQHVPTLSTFGFL